MESERDDLERLLHVGIVCMFHADPLNREAPRFRTVLRGWQQQRSIILDYPLDNEGVFAPLIPGQHCVIRYIYDGRACAFNTRVTELQTRSEQPHVRLLWPREIQYTLFRRFERLRVLMPCRIEVEGGREVTGEIRDISIGGCSLSTALYSRAGEKLSLSFVLPDGYRIDGLCARVRTPGMKKEKYTYGLQFCEGQDHMESDIAFFVTTTLNRRRIESGGERNGKTLLVIEDDVETATVLKRSFQEKQISVILANNSVDGLYRLRMLMPCAVVIGHVKEVSSFEISRLIRLTADFREMPIFVTGGTEVPSEDQIQSAGVTCYFPTKDNLIAGILQDMGGICGGNKESVSVDISE